MTQPTLRTGPATSTDAAAPTDDTSGGGPVVPRRKTNLALLGGSMATDGGEGSIMTTLFPVIQASLGLATSALGILAATGRIVGAVAGPAWVLVARKTGRKGALALATGFWGLWGVAAGFSQNFTQLLVLYAIMAMGPVAAHTFVPAVIGDSFEEKRRGRVVGWVYGGVTATSSLLAPLIGQLANIENGWRYGFFAFGAVNVLFGVLILAFYKDPGVGSGEAQLREFDQKARDAEQTVTWDKVKSLLKIPSFVVLLGSRLLSSHLLLASFGVVLLVQEYGFDTAVAATVMAPFGFGYLAGTFLGGILSDALHKVSPNYGRVAFLQAAQLAYAVIAFFATQFAYGGIAPYLVLFALVGAAMGVNPGVNRPLVMSVTPPELRPAAFAIFVSIAESVGFAIYTLTAGFLAEAIGMRATMLWLVVGIMTLNAVYLTLLYKPFRRDRDALGRELERRHERLAASSGS
ncbi:MFS transporter [Isoptericola aurantiacus]|uniref:MFS transporter n=1 Tax=Isoptericola aurantiacus TaxID=3377839 RepID=UPI00383B8AEE